VNKKPYPYCSRWRWQTQIARLAERGHDVHRDEPEFMLLARRADRQFGARRSTDDLDKPCYDYKGLYARAQRVDEIGGRPARRRDRVYQSTTRRQRPVRDHFSMRTRSNPRQFTFVKMAASEIAHKQA